jgi:hypothetical protein
MEDVIELNGGPYIVKMNENGGIIYEYGWAELKITGKKIQIVCDNDGEYRSILSFNIDTEIPREYKYLEKIQIYLKNGFGAKRIYNYSNIVTFREACKKYFILLSKEIINDK